MGLEIFEDNPWIQMSLSIIISGVLRSAFKEAFSLWPVAQLVFLYTKKVTDSFLSIYLGYGFDSQLGCIWEANN